MKQAYPARVEGDFCRVVVVKLGFEVLIELEQVLHRTRPLDDLSLAVRAAPNTQTERQLPRINVDGDSDTRVRSRLYQMS